MLTNTLQTQCQIFKLKMVEKLLTLTFCLLHWFEESSII